MSSDFGREFTIRRMKAKADAEASTVTFQQLKQQLRDERLKVIDLEEKFAKLSQDVYNLKRESK